jgi:2-phospho-L-lactate guanylyltransferase (CobY/MobA/RfbA family)
MNKPTQNFKLPKYVKNRMATIVDAETRNSYKNAMIQATLDSMKQPPAQDKK